MTEIKLLHGLRCKACDSSLGSESFDPELCHVCYEAICGFLPEQVEEEYVDDEVVDDYAYGPEDC